MHVASADRASDPQGRLSLKKKHVCFGNFLIWAEFRDLLTPLVYKPRLAASIVTVVALLRYYIAKPVSYVLEPLPKLIRNPTLSFMNLLPGGFWSHRAKIQYVSVTRFAAYSSLVW